MLISKEQLTLHLPAIPDAASIPPNLVGSRDIIDRGSKEDATLCRCPLARPTITCGLIVPEAIAVEVIRTRAFPGSGVRLEIIVELVEDVEGANDVVVVVEPWLV